MLISFLECLDSSPQRAYATSLPPQGIRLDAVQDKLKIVNVLIVISIRVFRVQDALGFTKLSEEIVSAVHSTSRDAIISLRL